MLSPRDKAAAGLGNEAARVAAVKAPGPKFELSAADHTPLPADCEGSQVLADLPDALEREGRFDVRWVQLARHRIWRHPPLDPGAAPELPPHGEWSGHQQWPCGVDTDAGIWRMSIAFVRFIWQLSPKGIPAWCIFLASIVGTADAAIAVLLGYVVDEVTSAETSIGESTEERRKIAYAFIASMVAVYMLKVRLWYQFQVDVPACGMRHQLRHVLMRRLQGLRGDPGETPAPSPPLAGAPGAALALLGPGVSTAVDGVWCSMFDVATNFSSALATIVVTCVSLHRSGFRYRFAAPIVVGFEVARWLSVYWLADSRMPPLLQLARLKMTWRVRYYSLAADALSKAPTPARELPPARRVSAFADAAFVYKMRGFHSYFLALITDDIAKIFLYMVYIAVLMVSAHEVIDGDLTIGAFSTIIAASASQTAAAGTLISMMASLPEAHVAVQQLATVINDDGGGGPPCSTAAADMAQGASHSI